MKRFGYFLALIGTFLGGYAAGTGDAEIEARKQEQYETITMRVTAYCPCPKCCGKWADGVTASGHKIEPGDKFCAADKRYPFGTILDIPGYGRVPVLDRGGAIKGDKIDVFFDDDPKTGKSGHQRALEWGVQNLVVTVER